MELKKDTNIDYEGCVNIIGEIIKYAVDDLKRVEYQKSAYRFLMSEWFEHLCDLVRLAPDQVRKLAGLEED